MKCPKCKADIEDDSRFCKHCGASIDKPVEKPAAEPAEELSPADKLKAAASEGASDHKDGDVYRDPKHEKQIWQGRPAWRSYYGLWAIWALLSAIALGAAYKWLGEPAVFLAWAVVLGAGVAILVREALFVVSLRYRLTTQRLFIHRGILTRTTDQTELIRIDDVRIKQGIVDRLVNTGDVEVMGTDETDDVVTLRSVNAPAEVAEALRTHVRGARSKGSLLIEEI